MTTPTDLQAALFAAWQDPQPEALAHVLSHVADDALYSEIGRRRGAKAVNRSGGLVWGHHNPDATNCRCARCNTRRRRAKPPV